MHPNKEAALGRRMLEFEEAQIRLKKRGPLPCVKQIPVPPKPCAEVKRLTAILNRQGPLDAAAISLAMRAPSMTVRGTISKAMRAGSIRKISPYYARNYLYEAVNEQ
jgi:hypothetical protein